MWGHTMISTTRRTKGKSNITAPKRGALLALSNNNITFNRQLARD